MSNLKTKKIDGIMEIIAHDNDSFFLEYNYSFAQKFMVFDFRLLHFNMKIIENNFCNNQIINLSYQFFCMEK